VLRKTLAAVLTALWLGLLTPAVVILYITWNGGGENGIIDRGVMGRWLIYACCMCLASAAATFAAWHSVHANPSGARLRQQLGVRGARTKGLS
jgi:hypothetical protein